MTGAEIIYTAAAGVCGTASVTVLGFFVRSKIEESRARRDAFAAHVRECDERRAIHAGLEARVGGIEQRMADGFTSVHSQLHEISENMRRFS